MTSAQAKLSVTLAALGVIASSFTGTAAMAEKETLVLQPSSKWQVDYADDSCRLARQFGEGEQTSVLILDRYEPGDSFTMIVSGKPFGGTVNGDKAHLRFGPAEEEKDGYFASGDLNDQPAMIFASTSIGKLAEIKTVSSKAAKKSDDETAIAKRDGISDEREEAVRFLQIDAYGFPPVLLETGSLGAPMKALRTCVDELMSHWGVDVERIKTATRMPMPIGNVGRWVTSSDYPKDLLRKGAQGLVNFRLSIDEKGKVTDCHIQASTRPQGFDDAVCEAISKRARFKPALDAEGKPLASYWISRVRFEIPS
ncbi:energy transducer TonB [Novosphingopyxis sp.]|uniref:energy transducer TonB n=1 Tax=Novosphingopyxis sp. TaxID=2709690 RepID=UPI003B5C8500